MRSWSQAEQRVGLAHTAVHDDGQPCRFRDAPGLLRDDPELEPEYLCPDRDGLPCDLRSFLGGAEHLHNIHGYINLRQRAEHTLSEELATARVHRQDAVALALQVAWDLVRGLRRICRCPNHRNSPGLGVDAQEPLALRWVHITHSFISPSFLVCCTAITV